MRPPTGQQHAVPNQQLMEPSGYSERPQPGVSTRFADQTVCQGFCGVCSPQAPSGPSACLVPCGRSVERYIRTLGVVSQFYIGFHGNVTNFLHFHSLMRLFNTYMT